MNLARKAALVILTPLLPLLLFSLALDFGIMRIVGHSGSIKKIIADSGLYNNVVSDALNQAQTQPGGNISLSDSAIGQAANKALSPAVLQDSTNQVIDGIYAWLDGKTSQPNFKVDLSGAKSTFARAVGAAAETRAASLPPCNTQPVSFDAFSTTCLPKGLSAPAAGQAAQESILSRQGFLDNPVITPGSIKDSNNQSVFETKFKDAPQQYQRAKKTPYILATLSVLAALGIVLLNSSWQRGLRRVGITMGVVGIVMLLFAWGTTQVVNSRVLAQLKFDNSLLQADGRALVKNLASSIEHNYWLFGASYMALGIVAWFSPQIYARARWYAKPAAKAPGPDLKADSKSGD